MSNAKVSLQQVISGLQVEGLMLEESSQQVESVVRKMSDVHPWYIRTMVGIGAWLASLLLIGFVASIGVATGGGFSIIGVALIVGAIFARRGSDNDFMVQCSLACSLAGQAILAYGIVAVTKGDKLEGVLSLVTVISTILFFIFPDRIHRVLSVMIATTSISVLLYMWKLNAIVPLLGPTFAAVLVYLHGRQGSFIENGKGRLTRPLMTGMMLSAFGFLLLSTVYVLPELGDGFAFYPRPWISTALLGALFLYMGTKMWPQVSGEGNAKGAPVFYGLLVAVIAAAWSVPGLLLALIVVILGTSSGNKVFTGAGITFLTVFVATFFYGIQVTMLTKSITLVAIGATVLIARWLLLKVVQGSAVGGASHA